MLGLKLIHVSKRSFIIFQLSVYLANGMQWDAMNLNMNLRRRSTSEYPNVYTNQCEPTVTYDFVTLFSIYNYAAQVDKIR